MKTFVIQATDRDDFVKKVNTIRRNCKKEWCDCTIEVETAVYRLKFYDTWIQIFRKIENGTVQNIGGSTMGLSVSDFKQFLHDNF